VNIGKLDKMVELQAKIYNIANFDLSQAIFSSKNSSEKMFDYTTSSNQTFNVFPIIAIFISQSGKIALLLLPDEKCIFARDRKDSYRQSYYNGNDDEIPTEQIVGKLSVGDWILTEELSYSKGTYELKAFLCEKTKADTISLLKEIEKTNKSGYRDYCSFANEDPLCYSLASIQNKVREASIKKIVNSLEIQLVAFRTWQSLSQIFFDMPSVETSRITFKSDNHAYIFVYPCRDNPSKKLVSDELKKPEEIEDSHYWFDAVRNDWAGGMKNKLAEGINYFIAKKDWFEFSIDGKQLKVEMKDSKRGVQRIYVEGIPTRTEEVIPALLSLKERPREDVIYDLDKTHKLSPEMEDILKKGLFGNMTDLENKIQVNAKVVRHGNRYSVQLDGKEYQVEGGFQTVKKLQSCLEGNSKRCARWDRLDVQWNRDAKLFIDLLVEALGEKKAIEFYQLIKQKDAENKLLDTKTLKEFINQHPEISKASIDKEPCFKIRIRQLNGFREFYFFGFRGFELASDGKKHNINNLRAKNYGEGENHSDESNILYNLQFILDGKAEVNSYGF
jgi:hypothetical protein